MATLVQLTVPMTENETIIEKPKHTVLVAEDDEFLSRVLTDKLEKAGFAVVTAFDGEEAVSKMNAGGIDVMILDIIMPKKTGFDVIDTLKNNSATKNIPIIVLSNLGQDDDVKRAKEKGVNDYFVKANISLVSVVEMVNKCLQAA